ncbi:chemotaxis protein CheB [Pedobacter insulae]|uniref:protein-glutamate methylesterase n=1 Tax=Pedobacter insulae TaxID=414048 RepID=A0A1I2XHZ8_9SPHI|nr:chemotaxis protein CheB [Pedobacter insulae]SFH13118.1 two-component system, chemotaxis family, response regulator CheB [Pedobacter insulae]
MKECKALIIAGSAGSLEVLLKVLPDLRTDMSFPIIIVVHRKQGADFLLADLLSARTKLKVKEVEEKEEIMPKTIYIAPSDYHLLIEKEHTFSLDYSEKVNYSRPSIDVTFQSAAEVYTNKLACLLLSGSNADGVNGLETVTHYKGVALAQDPSTASVSYMPEQAILKVKIAHILKPEDMASYINSLNQPLTVQ